MKAQLFGIQKLDFTTPDGEVKGLKFHFFSEPDDKQIANNIGFCYDKQFVRPDSKVKVFGFSVAELFNDFDNLRDQLIFPMDVKVNFELVGRKVEFAGIEVLK